MYVMRDLKRKNSRPQVGLICCVHYQDYIDENIKVHEKTLDKTIERLTKLYQALGAYTGFPILFSEFGDLYSRIHELVDSQPNILSVQMDGIDHQIYELGDSINKETLEYFQKVPSVYVADGHHRLKAYTALIQKIQNQSETYSMESVFVKNPESLPTICKPHSIRLIELSLNNKENIKRIEKAEGTGRRPPLIIREDIAENLDQGSELPLVYFILLLILLFIVVYLLEVDIENVKFQLLSSSKI